MDDYETCVTDTEEHYYPTWLSLPREFEDRRIREAEAFNDLLTQHLDSSVETWECNVSGWIFELPSVTVLLYHGETSPLVAKAESQVLPRKFLDSLRNELRMILNEGVELSTLGLATTLLRTVEEAVACEKLFDKKLEQHQGRRATAIRNPVPSVELFRRKRGQDRQGFDVRAVRSYDAVIDNPVGVNLSSISDTAPSILEKSIGDICRGVGEDFRILHVEPVFRNDLVSAFTQQRERIFEDLRTMSHDSLRKSVPSTIIRPHSSEDTREGLARELSKPIVTFHGAPRAVIESIVRYGFLVPGSKIGESGHDVGVSRGSTYGRGIYSSPDASYASSYLDYRTGSTHLSRPSNVPGMRLIVCATLMGRPMQVDSSMANHVPGVLNLEAHSHVSPNGLEYIIFNSSQIIPCYVLHLDYGAERAKAEYEKMAGDPTAYFQTRLRKKKKKAEIKWVEDESSPGEIQRKKQAKKAAASKWFPYGYGPATGTSFVIEDIAEVSDDEELYGVFQYQRIEQESEIREGKLSKSGGNWFDEYQAVRHSEAELDPSNWGVR